MKFSTIRDTASGALLASLTFILVFSSFPVQPVAAATSPLFSMTLIAPTSNPVRRQWAAIIANSYQSANIDARLVYVSFGTLIEHMFDQTSPTLYANGGFDAGFVGWGGGTVLPDYGTNNVVNYRSQNLPPNGNNYAWYKNATYDDLAEQYANSFDANARAQIGQKMVRIVAQERPFLIIEYPAEVYAWASNISPWNQQQTESIATTGLDIQHFNVNDACAETKSCVLNVAETGDINSVNNVPTSIANSLYDRYVYGPAGYAGGGGSLEELDPRTLTYFNALATSITSSADHLDWTVKFLPHTWHSSAKVTADDYVFTYMSDLRADVGCVCIGTLQTLLGLKAQFTFLNGTTRYVDNGTYSATEPAGWTPDSTFKAVDETTFTFHISSAYVFADPILTGGSALPMHILEKIPASQWATSFWSTLQKTPTTVTWDQNKYGGNGSYAWAYGPVGDGPYAYKGYDTVAGVGTLQRFDNYYNATGLWSIGQFVVKTIHIDFIQGKDAAIAALKNGQVNYLDAQYTFNNDDISTLKGLGAITVLNVDPSTGWQEMGLNMGHPVFGTGTGTPLGQSDPSKAATAARYVRQALSYLIPRQYIIDNLLQGLAAPGITQICTCFGALYPSDVQPDPYDPTAARSFLAAAGYQTGVAPPSTGGTISLPPIPPIPPLNISGKIVTVDVKVPSFLLGNTFTVSGSFAVDPVKAYDAGGFAVVLEQSVDDGTTWAPVAYSLTTPGTGTYTISYVPHDVSGSVQYQVLFTGIPANYLAVTGLNEASLIQAQLFTDFGGLAPSVGRAANVTQPAYGPTSTITVGTLADVIGAITQAVNDGLLVTNGNIKNLAGGINDRLSSLQQSISNLQSGTQDALNQVQSGAASKGDVSNVQASVNSVSSQLSALSSQVSSLTNVAYAAIGIAVVLGLIAIALAMRKRS